MAKEAYLYGKRGLFIWQKRPVYMAKEAYLYGKRGLFTWQNRPIEFSIPEVIEQRGFAVVYVPHNSHDRCAQRERRILLV